MCDVSVDHGRHGTYIKCLAMTSPFVETWSPGYKVSTVCILMRITDYTDYLIAA